MADHYKVLGVGRDADGKEIRRAFSALAKEFHPDRNKDPRATEKFLLIKEAYDVLSNPERRKNHDAVIRLNEEIEKRKREEELEKVQQKKVLTEEAHREQPKTQSREKEKWVATRERIDRLTKLMGANRFADAEIVAGEILKDDSRNAVAWAAKGDISRYRGDLTGAQKHYAYAVQFDSRNVEYQKKFEEVLEGAERSTKGEVRDASDIAPVPAFVMGFIVLVGAAYTLLAKEVPILPGAAAANTITLGQIVMLLVAGVAVGACLTAANAMDPIDASLGSAVVKIPPAVVLGFVAVINYWLAVGLYFLIGTTQKAFNRSLSRLLGFSGLTVLVFAFAKLFVSGIAFAQTLAWGGNLVYIGAACGWFVADSLRRV